jgi:mannan polymerase II complex MNN10 subunit
MRRLSNSLPRFNASPYYADKEKLGRGRWSAQNATLFGRIRGILGRMGRKLKMQLLFLLLFSVFLLIFFNSRKYPSFHHPVDLMGSSL